MSSKRLPTPILRSSSSRRAAFWIPTALLARGVGEMLLGATDRATEDLSETVERALAAGAVEEGYLAQAQLALLAAKQGAWGEAGSAHGLRRCR